MNILTLVRYLFGSREAIQTIAGNRHALWVGLLFVLSAGFAREYDGEDLLHEPWYVVIPVGASLGTSFLLFFIAYGIRFVRDDVPLPPFGPAYLSFLGLFWMTAPLAWLYAIPYEHLLLPVDAMRANLWTLGVVSAWRVALMVRVLPVVLPYSHLQAFFLVMSFGTIVALILIAFLPVPLIDVMGGIRLSDRDLVMRRVALAVGELSCFSLVVCLVGLACVMGMRVPSWQPPASQGGRPGSLPLLAFAALAVWPFVLPHTQPRQQRRREVERLYERRRVAEALEAMSRHEQSEFPPGWEPPPRVFSIDYSPDEVLLLLEEMAKRPPADWVREWYLDRVARALGSNTFLHHGHHDPLVLVLRKIEGGPEALERGLELLREITNEEYVKEMRREFEKAGKRGEVKDDKR